MAFICNLCSIWIEFWSQLVVLYFSYGTELTRKIATLGQIYFWLSYLVKVDMMHCRFTIRTSVKKLVDNTGIALG